MRCNGRSCKENRKHSGEESLIDNSASLYLDWYDGRMTTYCERCSDIGKTRLVTDFIWCKIHHEMFLLEEVDEQGNEFISDKDAYEDLEDSL